MQDSLSERAAELAHLTDLIRDSLSLADAAIPLINERLNGLAEMGIDNLELEGPRIFSRTAGWSPTFDDEQLICGTVPGRPEQPAYEPLSSRATLAEVPLAGLSLRRHIGRHRPGHRVSSQA